MGRSGAKRILGGLVVAVTIGCVAWWWSWTRPPSDDEVRAFFREHRQRLEIVAMSLTNRRRPEGFAGNAGIPGVRRVTVLTPRVYFSLHKTRHFLSATNTGVLYAPGSPPKDWRPDGPEFKAYTPLAPGWFIFTERDS